MWAPNKERQHFSKSTGGTFDIETVMVIAISLFTCVVIEINELTDIIMGSMASCTQRYSSYVYTLLHALCLSKVRPRCKSLKNHYTAWPDQNIPQTNIVPPCSFVRVITKTYDKGKDSSPVWEWATETLTALHAMIERLKSA